MTQILHMRVAKPHTIIVGKFYLNIYVLSNFMDICIFYAIFIVIYNNALDLYIDAVCVPELYFYYLFPEGTTLPSPIPTDFAEITTEVGSTFIVYNTFTV